MNALTRRAWSIYVGDNNDGTFPHALVLDLDRYELKAYVQAHVLEDAEMDVDEEGYVSFIVMDIEDETYARIVDAYPAEDCPRAQDPPLVTLDAVDRAYVTMAAYGGNAGASHRSELTISVSLYKHNAWVRVRDDANPDEDTVSESASFDEACALAKEIARRVEVAKNVLLIECAASAQGETNAVPV